MLLHNTPIKATQSCKYEGTLPQESSFLKIDNYNIVIDALKKAEDKDSIILRFHNPTNKKQNVTISADFFKIKNAYYVNFLEERKGKIPIGQKNKIKLTVEKKKIVTIEFIMKSQFKMLNKKEKWDWFMLKLDN
jgi:alpha-mannosidase